MRVVEYNKKTESVPYRTLQGLGIVAGILSLVVCLLMIANNLSLKHTDPIHSPALLKLLEDLKASPKDEAIREERLKNWPSFRGASNGLVANAEVPIDWDGESGRGVVWKTAVPNPGFSSPIVWENRIFLSGGDKDVREVYCFDTEKGELLWQHSVTGIPQSPTKAPNVNRDTGYAAATMTTDGTRVFAIFATGDLVALDFEGNRVWGRNLGVPDNPYGHSSSLALFEDILLVQFDHKDGGALFGLAVETGDTR